MGNCFTSCCSRRPRARRDGDLYALLGVALTASHEEIEAAMRRVADAHGPGSDGDSKLYEQATHAYEVLSDPRRRARYDESLQSEPTVTVYGRVDDSRPPTGGSRAPPIHTRGGSASQPQPCAAVEYIEPDDGFLAAETSYGLWNGPTLLQRRIPSNKLQLHTQLSKGAFGDAWLGNYMAMQVVVKQLREADQTQDKAVLFVTEIMHMIQLSHPKITTFMGVHWTKQTVTRAVAEYLPQGSLSALLRTSQAELLDWADFKCQVAMDVVDALAYLQTTGSVMESFTSRNVLLDGENGSCKLSVFAAARGRRDLTASPYYLEWIAPEILLGESAYDAAKCAIYSLGVLLCELDSGKLPFWDALNPDGSRMPSFKIALLVSQRKLRPSVSDACPEGIASLVSECLAFDPQARPTAASVGYKLRDVLKNEL